MKDTFKYLDIPPVEAITVHDDFDCHSKCLENSKCHSINVAASKAADGKLWCELLSSDKYKNFTMYHVNQTSNHYFRKVSDFVISPWHVGVFKDNNFSI